MTALQARYLPSRTRGHETIGLELLEERQPTVMAWAGGSASAVSLPKAGWCQILFPRVHEDDSLKYWIAEILRLFAAAQLSFSWDRGHSLQPRRLPARPSTY
jgi:hypothetical protein